MSEGWLPARPAVFASSFHPHVGGVEEMVRQLTRAQTAAGAQPVVHTMRWPRDLPAREMWEGIDIRRHSYRVPEGSVRRVVPAMAGNPMVLADVVRQLRADRADAVHVQCVSSGSWFAYRAARMARLPVVVTLHGELTMDADDIYERSPLLRHTLRMLLADADVVTACSQATLREAEDWSGRSLGDRGRVVHNGVDLTEFAGVPAPREPGPRGFVLAVGRLVRQKGFDVLLDAFASLARDAAFEWDLVIAGDGPERAALESLAARAGVGNRVRFAGRTDRAETVALFTGAAVFVLPSRQEPFGIVNLEAMAAGTPVVATRVGGVPEIVDDEVTGLLVGPADTDALVRALRRLHDDPELCARLAAAGRADVAGRGWPAVEEQYREVYAAARAARTSR
ncbi:MAG TPA: glycosyltransferase family 4 protein [Acidimicrobiia bacterium]